MSNDWKFDWRGTEIKVGSHVIYATSSSNSVNFTEGTVAEINEDKKNFKLNIIRREGYGSGKLTQTITSRNMFVVDGIVKSNVSTQEETNRHLEEKAATRKRNEESHNLNPQPKSPRWEDFVLVPGQRVTGFSRYDEPKYKAAQVAYHADYENWRKNPCRNCGTPYLDIFSTPCPSQQWSILNLINNP